MGLLMRAVVTGFGLSVGAALYRKLSKQLGIEEQPPAQPVTVPTVSGTPRQDDVRGEPAQA